MSDTDYQYGFLAGYNLSFPLDFTAMRGDGISHDADVCFVAFTDPESSYSICGTFSYTESEGKIFANTDVEGSYTDFTEYAGMVGMGRTGRLHSFYNDEGERWGALTYSPSISFGVTSVQNQIPDRTIGGEVFSSDPTYKNIFTMRQTIAPGFELTFGRFPHLRLDVPIEISTSYNGDWDEWNSVGIKVGPMLSIGLGDDMGRPEDGEPREPNEWEIAYLSVYNSLDLMNRIFRDRTLNQAAETVTDMIEMGVTDGPVSTEDLVYLGGVISVFGSFSLASARQLALSSGKLSLLPILMQAGGGVVMSSTAGSDSGRGNGYADILTATVSIIQLLWGIDEYSEREELGPEETNKAMLYTLLVGAALPFASVAAGIAIDEGYPGNDFGNTLALGGAGALAGLSLGADPSDVDTSASTYSPAVSAIYNGEWNVALGLDIHTSWKGLPFYSRFFALTDGATAYNSSVVIGSEFGAEFRLEESPYFHIGGGLGAATKSGGLASGAGIFAGLNLGFTIPLGESGSALEISSDTWGGYMGDAFIATGGHLGIRL